ncbi:1,2-phenylacetyl-CoA epoxidase subunit PaaC [Actinophytocola gossypii]|uniref:Phenylacetate-CoA oxygenase subunit PaaC n=1 Tax=Actinophytocola gossypii TaxID=2812003 RepID=A0ABT2JCP1_9PSEU|nr:1,2-phenylacetyl-CoA epoxidase subunit PaaC [Actinophytocola gossypii]MCT2585630.1 phenylacetate-CoA oxygenase subunit PaaC [Actinophytocola gossypii]
MSFDNAYDAITDGAGDDQHWAFGTGFDDPLAGVDRAVPADTSAVDLSTYCLMLADDALILSQRLTEWCSRAPELEEDVALANIALDLLGQARLLLTRAGEVEGAGRDEDTLAYLRDEHEFRNVRLVELDCGPGPGGDFATTIARLLVFSTWRLAVFTQLAHSADPVLAAIAAKGVKELAYHRDHAAQWTLRLAGGTDHSRTRMIAALDQIWPLVDELFTPHPVEQSLPAIAVDPATARPEFDDVLDTVLTAATLPRPTVPPMSPVAGRTGRDGAHTEALGYLLAEMQHLARSLPGATW